MRGMHEMPKTPNRPWTAAELNVMAAHYGTMATSVLQSHYLPDRTVRAIELKAFRLGLSCDQSRINWTEDELRTLREAPPGTPVAELRKLLPNRTENAIHAMMSRPRRRKENPGLNTRGPRRPWTDEEKEILKKYARTMTSEELHDRFLPDRTPHAIQNAMRSLVPSRIAKWLPSETACLVRCYGKIPTEELISGYMPGKTVSQVYAKARQLGIRKKYNVRRWSDEELDILRTNMGRMSVPKIKGLIPNRSTGAIYIKIHELRNGGEGK